MHDVIRRRRVARWRSGTVLGLRAIGRGFELTHTRASVAKQYNLVLANGR